MDSRNNDYYAKLSGEVKDRYNEKIQKCGGTDPYIIKSRDLSLNPKDFPDISTYDIGKYMIDSVSSYTKKFYDNFKGTEAYSYFESGFVLSLGSKKNAESAIVKGKVKHSQKMNLPPLQVWIFAKMNGEILCAHCTCIAGLSETCSHVGAICFAVKHIAESSESIKSVTDVLCKWNVPKFKDVAMSSATEINWRFRSNKQSMLETSFLEHCVSINNLSDERIKQFIDKCHSDGDVTAIETVLYPSELRRSTNLRDEIFLASLYNENYRNKTLSELVEISKSISLNISNNEAEEISRLTSPQLKSKCWFGLQRGRITGSNFKNCCVTNINDPSFATIRRVIHLTKGFVDVPSIKHKKKTIEKYTRMVELNHENVVYEECGLKINTKIPCFAGSPDGLVSCICHGNGCMKTKYLNILVSDASLELMSRKPNNILKRCGNKYYLEETHEFFYHAQLLINLIDVKYCDFVIWSLQKAIVLRVFPNIEFWKVAMKKASTFHEQVIMPELLGKFYTERIGSASSIEEEEDEQQLIDLEIEFLSLTEE